MIHSSLHAAVDLEFLNQPTSGEHGDIFGRGVNPRCKSQRRLTMTTPSRISIIGAGPGGLLCGRAVARAVVGVTLYDVSAFAEARNQGGTLDLRETGLLEEKRL
jgi:hypothetical protein